MHQSKIIMNIIDFCFTEERDDLCCPQQQVDRESVCRSREGERWPNKQWIRWMCRGKEWMLNSVSGEGGIVVRSITVSK